MKSWRTDEPTLGHGPVSSSCASPPRSEEHTSELQSQFHLVCRLLLEKKKKKKRNYTLEVNNKTIVLLIAGDLNDNYKPELHTAMRTTGWRHELCDLSLEVEEHATRGY